jgi:hypothetical protein
VCESYGVNGTILVQNGTGTESQETHLPKFAPNSDGINGSLSLTQLHNVLSGSTTTQILHMNSNHFYLQIEAGEHTLV